MFLPLFVVVHRFRISPARPFAFEKHLFQQVNMHQVVFIIHES